MGFFDAVAEGFTDVVNPKNLLTAGGAVFGGPWGAAGGRALGQATFGGDWDPGHSGEEGGIGRVVKAGAEGYGLGQAGSFAADKVPGLFSGGGAEAAGSGMMRDAGTRFSEGASAFANEGMGSQGVADQVLGEVPDLSSQVSGTGGTSYASAVGGGGGGYASEPIYGLSETASGGGSEGMFGTGLSPMEGMVAAQGLGTLGSLYGSYKQGQLADERRKRRRRVMSAFMPLMEQRLKRYSD